MLQAVANGFVGKRVSDAELETIDLVMLGLETWDPERHKSLTGQDHAPTLEFARRLALGLQDKLNVVEPPTQETVERACAVWRTAGLEAS